MHEAGQSGGRSPKQMNGPSSTQQLKSVSDNLQNSGPSLVSQVKGKRRDRSDQLMEPIKRERMSKVDDGTSTSCKFDNYMIKFELSKILEKGALISTDAVEKLVQLMQVDNSKKIDLTGRVLLADVIATADSIGCLNKFMQVGGVTVLDEWLQEAHKRKNCDPKESDKTVEELLLALLRALDKLPVNLQALQACNIGKSVNHLRSHKNLEIQKKARSLVDTWKKRVDLEMKMNDTKPAGDSQTVTWQVKPGFSEVSHAGNWRNGSGELSMKNTLSQQSISKGLSGKSVHTDSANLTPVIVASGKLQSSSVTPVGSISKGSLSKDAVSSGNLDLPQMMEKEEKSSCSSQSQNNSLSCSSDHGKAIGSSLKEDARSSTAGSVNKSFGGSSRNRRSNNGFIASNILFGQKESNSGKPVLLIQNTISEKVSHAGLFCERTIDVLPSERGSCHRLISKLPNPGCSPARSTSGGSLDDPSAGSRTSSPGVLDKHEHGDGKVIERNESGRTHMVTDVNAESWQSNDVKEGLVGCDEGDRLSMIVPDEEKRDEDENVMETPRTMCSLSCNENLTRLTEAKLRDSLSSMNVLIESCAKYSETTTPLSGEDIGMNLLASVAAEEMPKYNVVSSASSPKSSLATEDPCSGTNEAKTRFSSGNSGSQNLSPSDENTDLDSLKHGKDIVLVFGKDEIPVMDVNSRDDNKVAQEIKHFSDVKEEFYREDANQNKCDRRIGGLVAEGLTDRKSVVSSPVEQIKTSSSSPTELSKFTPDSSCKSLFHGIDCDVSASGRDVENLVIAGSSLCRHFNKDLHVAAILTEQKSHSAAQSENEMVERTGYGSPTLPVADKAPCLENVRLLNSKMFDGSEDQCLEQTERYGSATLPSNHNAHCESSLSHVGMANGSQTTERKAALEKRGAGSDDYGEAEACANMSADDAETKEELASSVEISSFVTTSEQDAGAKLSFDLNEGIVGDDVNQSEPIFTSAPDFSPTIRISSLSPVASPVTVAAPAKGFFMPPEILLRNKGDLGWKGSAATSAFRPAEPRKVLEMSFNSSDVHSFDISVAKHGRPLLEFDLNVADERALEDMASQNSTQTTCSESGIIIDHDAPSRAAGVLDFDLNRLDEGVEDVPSVQSVASTKCRFEVPSLHARPTTIGFPNGDANMLRSFDLNSGPCIDDVGTEPLSRNQNAKRSNNMPFFPPNAHIRMNNTELGRGWLPPFNSYPAVALSSFMNDREQSYPIVAASGSQRILGPIAGAGTFGSDIYQRPVFSSSPAMAYSPAATTFSYAGFPFGTSFPLASSSFTAGSANFVDSSSGGCSYFPHIPSLVGATGAVSSPYTRPYVISHPEGSAAIGFDSRKWARQGLDLNAGPGCAEDVKDDRLPSSRQLHPASSQSFLEDQARLFQVAGGALKRKETDGSWEPERLTFKHPSLK